MPEYARVCQSVPEYARVCQAVLDYARVCQSMPEYARVCQSTEGGTAKWLQYYIGGGMPKWLQYYIGGGVSQDPQKWLHNMCTTPSRHHQYRHHHCHHSSPEDDRKGHWHSCIAMSALCTGNHDLLILWSSYCQCYHHHHEPTLKVNFRHLWK